MVYPPKIGSVFRILGGYKNVLCAASVFHYQQIVQPPPQKKKKSLVTAFTQVPINMFPCI